MLPNDVTVLGDPHLGRKFKTGVPLHRVGEREEMVWADFEKSLMSVKTKLHVNMGDLFDKFIVAPEIVIRAVELYKRAAAHNQGTHYVILEGNHDCSKDSAKMSSFDLFSLLVEHQVGDLGVITVVRGTPTVIGDYGFVPHHPFRPTADLVAELPDNLKAVFGHWDIVDYGGDNVIPTKLMAEKGIKLAVSGHDHLARTEKRHGVDVIVTGSMQPYTHAEDNTGEWYLTTELPITGDVSMKNVRVLLKEGETLPDDLDCLSLVAKRIEAEGEEIEVDTSDFDTLDIRQLLARALDDNPVKEKVMECFSGSI